VSSPADFVFPGQRKDGFGLYDYNARFYSPYLNRFISPDPIIPDPANPQNFNHYAYALNNPVKYTDSSGHCIICIAAVLVGAALFVTASAPLPEGQLIQQQQDRTYLSNPSGGIGCTGSLSECHKGGQLKDFADNPNISQEEFNEFADLVAEEMYFGWTPSVEGLSGDASPEGLFDKAWSYGPGAVAGRGTFDTPFYNGGGRGGANPPPYSSDQQVCIEGVGCYGRSEVNYIAQGMWGASSGDSLEATLDTTDFWNQDSYSKSAAEGKMQWTKFGYNYYKDWLKKKEEEWNTMK
jgi:RHS repeat-associated protein